MKRTALFSVIFLTIICLAYMPSAHAALDETVTDKYPSAGPTPQQAERMEKEEYAYGIKDRVSVSGFADIQQGYDNNVDLNSKRHKDGFLQSSASVDVTYEQTDDLKFKAGLDKFSTIYYKYNANNLFDLSPYVGVDYQILPNLVSKNRFIYDYFWYPNYKESTFSGIVLSSYLRHFISRDLYHEIGYEYLKRWYPDQKTYLVNVRKGDDDRIDDRYRVKYNIGYYGRRFYVGLSNEYSWNDSNDTYQDYYDYWTYRVRPTFMYFFTEKIYTDLSLIYKHIHYKDRRSSEDVNKLVRDNTYILSTSLYYDITKALTLGMTYSYSENTSNDPFQKYSGSIVTGGLYCNF